MNGTISANTIAAGTITTKTIAPDAIIAGLNHLLKGNTGRRLRADAKYDQHGYVNKCHPPAVYFVQGSPGSPIKIGHTNNIKARLMNMQQGNPEKLKVLATLEGPRSLEAQLHERWDHYRVFGEWFKPTTAIINYIADINDGKAT